MLWFLKFGVTAVAAIALLKWAGDSDVQTVETTTDAQNYAVAARYLNRWTHKTVLVGSSLTFRLSEDYFQSDDVENLSQAGGSPVTGLQVIAGASTPRLVLVEANVLNRVVDDAILAKLKDRNSNIYRPVRSAAAYYETLMHPPLEKAQVKAKVDQLIAQPPSDVINSSLVDQTLHEAETMPPAEAVRRGLSDIQKYKAQLESRGAKVLLFHMPYSPRFETTPFAVASTQMAAEAFPDAASWFTIDVDRSQLRWSDGVHLDARSAAMVARAIEAATAKN
ncbi:hypothetical protein [Bradyrhizobium ivorense]|uniref:hypothetical protein n=1 Tax=Bradyrhizobium ivorense TaxID=2511166 RepID=UPI0010B866AD|nr:hypothetical protein [Bradyrhizobium ivorense]VIO71102.1 hypothetical protein CI41S_27730 [Bradyrhizobium ivorense]